MSLLVTDVLLYLVLVVCVGCFGFVFCALLFALWLVVCDLRSELLYLL